MTAWRLLDTGPLDGALNMAVDVTLMDRARLTGESVFRTYGWVRPTLSVGRNQAARNRYDLSRLKQTAVDVVRRPTGGRAILHWREVTYSVTAPVGSMPAAAAMYGAVNEILLASLRRLGIDAEIAHSRPARRPDQHPCFSEPGAGEIIAHTTAGTGKLIGSAQYVEDGVLLQHGSILLHDDQPLLVEFTGEAAAQTRAASISAALGQDTPHSVVAGALWETVTLLGQGQAVVLEFDEVRTRAETHVPHFRDPLWTWRR